MLLSHINLFPRGGKEAKKGHYSCKALQTIAKVIHESVIKLLNNFCPM